MTDFKERKNAFENKYAHDEKLGFDTEARASKIFGLWIAEKLGLEGESANIYAGEVVEANLEEPGFDDVLRKVKADLDDKDIEISDHVLTTQLEKAVEEAKKQLSS